MSRILSPKVIITTLVALALMLASRLLLPVPLPHIQVPAEPLFMIAPGFAFTNTMLGLVTSEIVLLLLAFLATRNMKEVPSGLQNFFEIIIEFWQDQAEQLIGADLAKRWLPLVLTLFLVVVSSNWAELVPGYDTIGIACESGSCPGEGEEGLPVVDHTYFETSEWMGLTVATAREGDAEHEGEEGAEGEHEDEAGLGLVSVAHAQEESGGEEGVEGGGNPYAPVSAEGEEAAGDDAYAEGEHHGTAFVPFLRVAASDLNFTLALALIAFIAIEIAGFQALGLGYMGKFFHIDFSHGVGQGLLNIFVGLLEFVSELSRIISFAFRLFGNMFAGQTLLFVFPFLVPLFLVLPIYGLELFVGLIQGFVFAILTLAFMSQAVADPHH